MTRGKGISSIRGGMLEMERCHIYGCKSSGLICRLIKNKKSGVFCYGSGTCDVLGNDTKIERNDDVDLLVSGGIINVHVMELTCGRRVENGGTIM